MHYRLIEPISEYIVKCVTFIMLLALNWANHFSRECCSKLYWPVHYSFQHFHDDVIKWKHFSRSWPFVRGIHRSRWIPQRPVTRSFDVFFDLRLNKRLSKQPWSWWFEKPSWLLWRQCNDYKGQAQHGFLLRLYKMIAFYGICKNKQVIDTHTHTHTHTDRYTDRGDDNTRRPKLASGNKYFISMDEPVITLPLPVGGNSH